MACGWWRRLEAFVVWGSLKACVLRDDEICVTTAGIVWPWRRLETFVARGNPKASMSGRHGTPLPLLRSQWHVVWRRPEACAMWGNLFRCLGATMEILRSPREFRGHTPGPTPCGLWLARKLEPCVAREIPPLLCLVKSPENSRPPTPASQLWPQWPMVGGESSKPLLWGEVSKLARTMKSL